MRARRRSSLSVIGARLRDDIAALAERVERFHEPVDVARAARAGVQSNQLSSLSWQ